MTNPDDVLDEMLSWIYNEPGTGDATAADVEWACNFALRKAELDAVLDYLPRALERSAKDGLAAVSTIRGSVYTAWLRYCATHRSQLVPFPDNEKIVVFRDAYALTLYLAVMTLVALEKAPTEAAALRLARLRQQIDRCVQI